MNLLLHFHLLVSAALLLSPSLAHEKFDSHVLPRPLNILEYQETPGILRSNELDREVRLLCDGWRFAVEANNLGPWKTVPSQCAEYVREYVSGRGYGVDLEVVGKQGLEYAKGLALGGDGKDVWIFDVDETLLSNLPYYADHGYGLEVFNGLEFDKWLEKAKAPAIESSLKLYEELLRLGIKVFLLTGRSERHRSVTEENLRNAGYRNWDKLILRNLEDHGTTATVYKSKKRTEMVEEGYRIVGNSGDQWSDLLGASMSNRSFKLPNPMYYIS
ncbi:hypothetical protein Syun_018456 [Stephania yunnanensis]|uniref:Acid phosphatase n=1 Tax=Stephania yunnanensis TaxID=152371 RepID=A0AAP0ISB7_9MAGN